MTGGFLYTLPFPDVDWVTCLSRWILLAQCFLQDVRQFYFLRFLLGSAEVCCCYIRASYVIADMPHESDPV